MAGASVITNVVGQLAAALHGPRRSRAGLLAEIRDGLEDAAAAHRSRGLSEQAAEARAVAEFGPVSDLAPLYQAELTATQARGTAALLAVSFPMLYGSGSSSGAAATGGPALRRPPVGWLPRWMWPAASPVARH